MTQVELPEQTLRRLLAAGRSLVTHLELEHVLDDVLEIATEVTGARYVALGVLNQQRAGLERFLTRGVDDATHRAIGDLPRGRGVLGELIEHPQPLRLRSVGDHPQSYGFPAGHPPMDTFLGVPILVRGQAWGNLYLTEKAGGQEFTEADEQAVVVLAEWAAIAIENARLYQSLRARHDELQRAVRGLEATTAIARAIGTETELDRVLELIVKRGRALVAARAVVLLLEDGDELVVAANAGQVQSDARGARFLHRGTVTGEVFAAGRPERVPDVAARLALDSEQLGVVGAETGLLVPLLYRRSRLGVLAAFDRLGDDPQFGDEDESLLQSFAASAATAVATARTVERERLSHSLEAAESERRRWARELHDETLQGLGALRVLLSSGLRGEDPEALRTAAEDAVAQIGQEIEGLRTLITELRPAALDELGLRPALESLLERAAAVEGLEVSRELELEGDRLEPELETTIYRLIQETLTNVSKHARANSVHVRVVRTDGDVAVEVADDGIGFDVNRPGEGFGLIGMRERAALVDGRVEIASSEAGTTVRGAFPLPRERAAAQG